MAWIILIGWIFHQTLVVTSQLGTAQDAPFLPLANSLDSQASSRCNSKIGIEDGVGELSASSERDDSPASAGRLNHPQSWCALVRDNSQWLAIDLKILHNISAISTQGNGTTSWVGSYYVQYSSDAINWYCYRGAQFEDESKEFLGNEDVKTPRTHTFHYAVTLRYIRVLPTTWNFDICMRLELYGCLATLLRGNVTYDFSRLATGTSCLLVGGATLSPTTMTSQTATESSVVPVSNVRIRAKYLYPTFGKIQLSTYPHQGTQITYQWDMGNGQKRQTNSRILYIYYSSPGKYMVTLNAVNEVSNMTTQMLIVVQDKIKGFEILWYKQAITPSQDAQIEWKTSKGTNVTFTVDFGDGTPREQFFVTDCSNFKRSFSHRYQDVGEFMIQINATNLVGENSTQQRTVYVERRISHLDITVNFSRIMFKTAKFYYLSVNENVTVRATVYLGSSVNLTYNFGDQVIGPTKDLKATHKYLKPGVFYINVDCFNHINSVNKSFPSFLKILEISPLEGLNLSVSPTVLSTNTSLLLERRSGNSFICYWDLGDGTQSTTDFTVIGQPLLYKYKHTGAYGVTVTCKNDLSEVTVTRTAHVQKLISTVSIMTEKSYIRIGSNVEYEITVVQGSDYNFQWNLSSSLNDVIRDSVGIEADNQTRFFTAIYNYTEPGQFIVNVTVWNLLSSKSAVTDSALSVEQDIDGLILSSDRSVKLREPLMYTIILPNGTPPPTAVTCKWDFGDGQQEIRSLYFTSSGQFHLNHSFEEPKVIDTIVNCTNQVSQQTLQISVAVENLVQPEIEAFFARDNGSVIHSGYGPDMNYFGSDETVTFEVTQQQYDIGYTWFTSDGSPQTSTLSPSLKQQFTNPGRYNITVVVNNNIRNMMKTIFINIQEKVKGVVFTGDEKTYFSKKTNFNIQVERYGTDICFVLDLGTNTKLRVFGPQYCRSTFIGSSYSFIITEDQNIQYSFKYPKLMTYTATLSASNKVSSFTSTQQIKVETAVCKLLNVRFLNTTIEVYRAQRFVIVASYKKECEFAEGEHLNWEAKLMPYSTPVDISALDTNSNILSVAPHTFTLGTQYMITFSIELYGDIVADLIGTVKKSAMVYATVLSTPMYVNLVGPSSLFIDHKATIVLDASGSYDPDDRKPQNEQILRYSWYCEIRRTVGGEANREGCFGSGPDNAFSTSTNVEVAADTLPRNQTVVFRVVVRNGPRTGSKEHNVYVVLGAPPNMKLSCSPSCQGRKVDPSESLTLVATCSDCSSENEVSLEWKLFNQTSDGTFAEEPELPSMTSSGINEYQLVLKPNVLILGQRYQLQIAGWRDGGAKGLAAITLVTSNPPTIAPTTIETTDGNSGGGTSTGGSTGGGSNSGGTNTEIRGGSTGGGGNSGGGNTGDSGGGSTGGGSNNGGSNTGDSGGGSTGGGGNSGGGNTGDSGGGSTGGGGNSGGNNTGNSGGGSTGDGSDSGGSNTGNSGGGSTGGGSDSGGSNTGNSGGGSTGGGSNSGGSNTGNSGGGSTGGGGNSGGGNTGDSGGGSTGGGSNSGGSNTGNSGGGSTGGGGNSGGGNTGDSGGGSTGGGGNSGGGNTGDSGGGSTSGGSNSGGNNTGNSGGGSTGGGSDSGGSNTGNSGGGSTGGGSDSGGSNTGGSSGGSTGGGSNSGGSNTGNSGGGSTGGGSNSGGSNTGNSGGGSTGGGSDSGGSTTGNSGGGSTGGGSDSGGSNTGGSSGGSTGGGSNSGGSNTGNSGGGSTGGGSNSGGSNTGNSGGGSTGGGSDSGGSNTGGSSGGSTGGGSNSGGSNTGNSGGGSTGGGSNSGGSNTGNSGGGSTGGGSDSGGSNTGGSSGGSTGGGSNSGGSNTGDSGGGSTGGGSNSGGSNTGDSGGGSTGGGSNTGGSNTGDSGGGSTGGGSNSGGNTGGDNSNGGSTGGGASGGSNTGGGNGGGGTGDGANNGGGGGGGGGGGNNGGQDGANNQGGTGGGGVIISEKEKERKRREERRKFIEEAAIQISQAPVNSIDDLEQSIEALKELSQNTSDLTTAAKKTTITTFNKLTNDLLKHAANSSIRQTDFMAMNIVSGLGNVMTAMAQPLSSTSLGLVHKEKCYPDLKIREGLDTEDEITDLKMMMETLDHLGSALLQNKTVSSNITSIESEWIKLKVFKSKSSEIHKQFIDQKEGSVTLPNKQVLLGDVSSETIGIKMLTIKGNPYTWHESAEFVKSPIIDLVLTIPRDTLNISNLTQNIEINIARDSCRVRQPRPSVYLFKTRGEKINYHKFNITQNSSFVFIHVRSVLPASMQWDVLLRHRERPNAKVYDWLLRTPRTDNNQGMIYDRLRNVTSYQEWQSRFVLDSDSMNGIGMYYIGFTPSNRSQSNYYRDALKYSNFSYSLMVYQASCMFWDHKVQLWSTQGCKVGHKTSVDLTQCLCNHLSSFAVGFYSSPYLPLIKLPTIFFRVYVDSPLVLITVITVASLFVLIAMWAKNNDLIDIKRAKATPVEGNLTSDKFLYEVTVYTGIRYDSATTSEVCLLMHGDLNDCGPRPLRQEEFVGFKDRGVDSFIITTPRPLGDITEIRLWHDNSGDDPSWYLSRVMIRDLITGRSYYFICEKWLAVEYGDFNIEQSFTPAGRDQMSTFHHLFQNALQRNTIDCHLWLSVYTRPCKSQFTRLQRLLCCVTFLFAAMMSITLFYWLGGESDPDEGMLGGRQVWIGIVTVLIVDLVVYGIDIMFRRAGPRSKGKKSNIKTAKKKKFSFRQWFHNWVEDSDENRVINNMLSVFDEAQMEKEQGIGEFAVKDYDTFSLPDSGFGDDIIEIQSSTVSFGGKGLFEDDIAIRCTDSYAGSTHQGEKKMLPFYAQQVAWILSLGISITCAYFSVMFGLDFWVEIAGQWAMSLMIAFLIDFFIFQPAKVVLIALYVAKVVKVPEDETEDKPTVKVDAAVATNLMEGSQINIKGPEIDDSKRFELYSPPRAEDVEEFRVERMNELKMYGIMKEMGIYITFLMCLFVVSFGQRDPNAYMFSEAVQNVFVGAAYQGKDLLSAGTIPAFWDWLNLTLVGNMNYEKWYNDDPFPVGYTPDGNTWFVGIGRVRQIRIQNNTCKIPSFFQPYITECNGHYSMFDELEGAHNLSWRPLDNNSDIFPFSLPSWEYHSSFSLGSIPYLGKMATYGEGGYIIEVPLNKTYLEPLLRQLRDNDWLDERTRGIVVEFALYNPQVNLFSMPKIVLEQYPTNGITYYNSIKIAKLYADPGGMTMFRLASQFMLIVFLSIFSYIELKELHKQGLKQYLKGFWNIMEFSMIVLVLGTIAVYFMRNIILLVSVKRLQDNPGKFVDFDRLGAMDMLFIYILGFLVFVANIKFMKLFRFNETLILIGATLRLCIEPLTSFMIVFFMNYMAYASAYYLIFGGQMEEYKSFMTTISSLFNTCMGSYDFRAMESANRLWGPLLFFTFMLYIVMYLMNIFLTIIMDAFACAQEDEDIHAEESEIVDYMMGRFKDWITFKKRKLEGNVSKRNKIAPFEEEKEEDHYSDIEELTQITRRDLQIREDDPETFYRVVARSPVIVDVLTNKMRLAFTKFWFDDREEDMALDNWLKKNTLELRRKKPAMQVPT